MFYARLNDDRTEFEKQRNIAGETFGFESTGAVTADEKGNVHLFWHGQTEEGADQVRNVYIRSSKDEGKTFGPLETVWSGRGACSCCFLKGLIDGQGDLYLAYRASEAGIHRDSYLLVSHDQGKK